MDNCNQPGLWYFWELFKPWISIAGGSCGLTSKNCEICRTPQFFKTAEKNYFFANFS